jgi:hypothetical protein
LQSPYDARNNTTTRKISKGIERYRADNIAVRVVSAIVRYMNPVRNHEHEIFYMREVDFTRTILGTTTAPTGFVSYF